MDCPKCPDTAMDGVDVKSITVQQCPQCGGPVAVILFMGVQPDGFSCPQCHLWLSDDFVPLATIIS